MENKVKINGILVRKIPPSKRTDNRDYEVYISASGLNPQRHKIVAKIANKVFGEVAANSPIKVDFRYNEAYANDKSDKTVVTLYIVVQVYDVETDTIILNKKQDYQLEEKTKQYIPQNPLVNAVENSIQGYWHKNKRVVEVLGPFTGSDCKTLVAEVKPGTDYYFKAIPNQALNKPELSAVKWQYSYDDGELKSFNHAVERVVGNTNVMSCKFHTTPKKIQVYAFFKQPSSDVSVAFTRLGSAEENQSAPQSETPATAIQSLAITEDFLDRFMSRTNHGSINKKSPYNKRIPAYIEYLNLYMEKFGLNKNNLRKAHFLGQVAKETKFWSYKEDFIYKKKALTSTFVNFKTAEGLKKAELWGYDTNKSTITQEIQIQVGNYAYGTGSKATKMGNSVCPDSKLKDKTQDGYNYRGRGLIQLTGKSNYAAFQSWFNKNRKELGLDEVDFVKNPDKILEPKFIVLSAIYFWDANKLNDLADKGIENSHVLAISNVINSGEDNDKKKIRREYVQAAYQELQENPGNAQTPSATASAPQAQASPGSWHEPVDNPRCTIYMQSGGGGKGTAGEHWGLFGKTRNGGVHQGLDLFVKPGSNIYSCVKAEVYESQTYGGYGKTLTLKVLDKEAFYNHRRDYRLIHSAKGEIIQGPKFDKSQDIFLFYAHLQKVIVAAKDANGNPTQVEAGKIVATSGVSGIKKGTCAPHLHFEIFTNKKAVGKGLQYRCNPGFYVHYKNIDEQSDAEIKEQKATAAKGRIS